MKQDLNTEHNTDVTQDYSSKLSYMADCIGLFLRHFMMFGWLVEFNSTFSTKRLATFYELSNSFLHSTSS